MHITTDWDTQGGKVQKKGHLNYDAILLRPETLGFCYLIFAGITRFKYNRKSEEDFGRGRKMTLLCKWPTKYLLETVLWLTRS